MPFTSSKTKVLAISFQNKYGAKYYSNYYLKHSSLELGKTEYDIKTESGQQKLQKSLFQKIKKMNVASGMTPDKTDIFSLGGFTCLFKVINQLIILLICEQDENYVLMESVINCIGNTLLLITKDQYNQKTVQQNLDSIVIAVDQVIDEGIIMCLNENIVYDRLKMRQGNQKMAVSSTKPQENSTGGAFSSIFGFAKNSLSKTLNFG